MVLETGTDVVGHINGGHSALPDDQIVCLCESCKAGLEIVHNGNERAALLTLNTTRELGKLYQIILGTDGPVETFGHPDESRVGHLIDDNAPLIDTSPESYAHDTHDLEDLAAEELAMHYVDEESEAELEGDDDLPEYLRASLAE